MLMSRKKGTVWFSQTKSVTLPPGGLATVTRITTFPASPCTQTVLVDGPEESQCPEDSRFPETHIVRPEIQTSSVVSSRRITVKVRNVLSRQITLKRGIPIAYLFL